jgi:hypothetical protein
MLESAKALRAKGLRPLIGTSNPALVNNPILIKSRRLTWPWEWAWMISQRFLRAFSASRKRAFEALGDKKKFLSDIYFSFVVSKPEGLPQMMDAGGEWMRSIKHGTDQVRKSP